MELKWSLLLLLLLFIRSIIVAASIQIGIIQIDNEIAVYGWRCFFHCRSLDRAQCRRSQICIFHRKLGPCKVVVGANECEPVEQRSVRMGAHST